MIAGITLRVNFNYLNLRKIFLKMKKSRSYVLGVRASKMRFFFAQIDWGAAPS